jgi:DtxR family transcriptional regulator, Mn-dependent transcriptional regulator
MSISLAEENYMKAIFSVNRLKNGTGVSTNELSQQLNNRAASVTGMLKKLASKKLIHYKKYKGVFLTAKGEKLALGIIRKHRLWEVFLTQKLKFSWDEVHDIAEQLEHIQSEELINRLDAYLGMPRIDPHGEPIPDSTGQINSINSQTLNTSKVKGTYRFSGVLQDSKEFLQYLSSLGLKIGDRIKLLEFNSYDGSCKIKINRIKECFLSEKVSSDLLVDKIK